MFRVLAYTELDECVRVVGNLTEFGQWKCDYALQLYTDNTLYPDWVSEKPLLLPKGT